MSHLVSFVSSIPLTKRGSSLTFSAFYDDEILETAYRLIPLDLREIRGLIYFFLP